MPYQTREDREEQNRKKAIANAAERDKRNREREARDEMRKQLSSASSASERRKIKGRFTEAYKTPKPTESFDNLVGYTSTSGSTSGDIGGGDGGGTFELDVVKDDNTAGRASFTGSGII